MTHNPDRRAILRLIAAGAAASVAGCSRPKETIYPAVNLIDGAPPGTTTRYATSIPLAGYGRGVTGLVVDERPIKLEGLAAHPASLGATDLFGEVSILDLYDPQRLRAPHGPGGTGKLVGGGARDLRTRRAAPRRRACAAHRARDLADAACADRGAEGALPRHAARPLGTAERRRGTGGGAAWRSVGR